MPHRTTRSPALGLAGGLLAAAMLATGCPSTAAAAPAGAGPPVPPNVHVAEDAGVRIRTELIARNYFFTVTNVSGAPIREIVLPVRHIAGIGVGDGWTYAFEAEIDRLVVSTDGTGLAAGRDLVIQCQAPFDLARLRAVEVQVTRRGSDQPVIVAGVWVPGPKRASILWLTAGGLVVAAGVHLGLAERRNRRAAQAPD